jgi:hypothetical protein
MMPASGSAALEVASLLVCAGEFRLATLCMSAVLSGMLIESTALACVAAPRASIAPGHPVAPPFDWMLITTAGRTALGTRSLTLAGSFTPLASSSRARVLRIPATVLVLDFLRHAFRQFGWRVSRVLPFDFLSNVIPQLLFLFLVLYPFPAVLNFVGAG